ncbi:hypothetical protein BFJ63_vAg7182 [Fusarium oxysporum f. sp. narcissi]|jgi:hypothetical protein|uniref:Uncharacterized protein n=4 Tax=Fusarium oxysporum TaxID=5507 RepID=A0A420U4V9_FUSOX|nr:hypothetical protein FOZG_11331 [Fusarium oxysporum Fo47]EWZ96653.1 hypothetical protein FOWG_03953 [Fusarium oxysporum f. sp. lycopersici MN25]KAJ4117405.1 hypothetical protein NW765_010824 [Fusarium oxysporum]RYC90054.1 hypothetical protein BFJ63_vAg7182 [Fusarium oxysporum f. sp. narcissi]RKL07086.1 hypothetical protein BFJ71_g2405 [Fusarium oxysporum]
MASESTPPQHPQQYLIKLAGVETAGKEGQGAPVVARWGRFVYRPKVLETHRGQIDLLYGVHKKGLSCPSAFPELFILISSESSEDIVGDVRSKPTMTTRFGLTGQNVQKHR